MVTAVIPPLAHGLRAGEARSGHGSVYEIAHGCKQSAMILLYGALRAWLCVAKYGDHRSPAEELYACGSEQPPAIAPPTGERAGVGAGQVSPQAFGGWHRWLVRQCCGKHQEYGQINCQWHPALLVLNVELIGEMGVYLVVSALMPIEPLLKNIEPHVLAHGEEARERRGINTIDVVVLGRPKVA